MSAQSTLASRPGAVSRRSPGNRLRGRLAGLRGTRARYLVPPLLAVVVIVGVQVWNAANPSATPQQSAISNLTTRGDESVDLATVTEIGSIGTVDTSDTDRRIEFWRQRAAAHPQSENEWIYIGDLFELKGRLTGDVSQYLAAQEAYTKALVIAPQSSTAHVGQARVLATLHDFAGALAEATTVLELDPSANGALAVMFDASVELGDLSNARRALALLDARVDSPSLSTRSARLNFLNGDTALAAQLADGAAADAIDRGDSAPSVAFYKYTAAEYQLLSGNLDAAESDYQAALDSLPGYPLAIYGLGRVAFARGDLATATAYLASAAKALPRPDILAFLGDLYTLTGQAAKATDQYATVDFIANLAASSGARVYDREYALYLADHVTNVDQALLLAQAEIEQRQDVYGYDALAWALHANGRDTEALVATRKALALGTADPKLLMHAGLIELANGLTDEGRAHLQQAIDLHPAISPITVQAARAALAQ